MEKPIELMTERLLLRRFTAGDLSDLIEYNNSPGFERYWINVEYPYTRKVAEKFMAMLLDTANWGNLGILENFAIVFGGKVIGEIHMNQHKEDRENQRAELVYALSSQHWNKGLVTEAARAVTNWSFKTFGFNRLYATCDPRNIGSWRVMEKIGMKREGLLRSHVVWKDEPRDQLYYGLLRGEWETNRRRFA